MSVSPVRLRRRWRPLSVRPVRLSSSSVRSSRSSVVVLCPPARPIASPVVVVRPGEANHDGGGKGW